MSAPTMPARVLPAILLVLALAFVPRGLVGQPSPADDTDGPTAAFTESYWHVATYELPADRLDGLREFLREVAMPVADRMKRDGELLERRWLVRDFGKDFAYIVMSRWADPDAIWAGRGPEEELAATFREAGRADRARRLAERVLGGVPYTSVLYREVADGGSLPLVAGADGDGR